MADTFTIPGLSEALAEWENLKAQINEAASELLTFAKNASEASKNYSKINGSADFTKFLKEANQWQEKVAQSTDKYNSLLEEQKQALENLKTAVANSNVQKQNEVNIMKLSTSQTSTLKKEVTQLTEAENKNTEATNKNTDSVKSNTDSIKNNTDKLKEQKKELTDNKVGIESFAETLKSEGDQMDTLKGKFSEFQSVFSNAFSQIASGDWMGALSTIITGFKTIFTVVSRVSIPFTAVIGILALVKVAFQSLSEEQKTNTEEWKRQQEMLQAYNEITQEVQKATDKRITKLKLLTAAAADETKSLDERMKAMKLLMKEDERYRDALVDGQIKTDRLKKATTELVTEILNRAKVEAYMNQISKNTDKITDLDFKYDELDKERRAMGVWKTAMDDFKYNNKVFGKSTMSQMDEIMKERNRLNKVNEELANRLLQLQGAPDDETGGTNGETPEQKRIKELETQLEKLKNKGGGTKSSSSTSSSSTDEKPDTLYIRQLRFQVMAYEAANNTKIMSDEDALKVFEEIQKQKTDILKAQLAAGLINQETYDDRVNVLKQEKNAADIQHRKQTLKEQSDYYTAQFELDRISADELYLQKQGIYEKDKELLKEELDNKLISQEDYNKQAAQLDVKYAKDTAEYKSKEYQLYVDNLKREMQRNFGNAEFLNEQELKSFVNMLSLMLEAEKKKLAAELKINEIRLQAKIANNEKLTEAESKYLDGVKKLTDDNLNLIEEATNESMDKIIEKIQKAFDYEVFGVNERTPLAEAVIFGKDGSPARKELQPKIDALTKKINSLENMESLTPEQSAQLQDAKDLREDYIQVLDEQAKQELALAAAQQITTAIMEGNAKQIIGTIIQQIIAYTIAAYAKKALATGNIFAAVAVTVIGTMIGQLAKRVIAQGANFEKGTPNAPYTGLATVDEKGAEIHTDKQGNVKSFGQNKGARLAAIERGDKIYPAPESKEMLKIFQKPARYSYLNFDPTPLIIHQEQNFDYEKMGKIIARNMEKQERQKVKKNFVVQDGQIIVIEEKGGLTKYIRNEKRDDLPLFN